MSLYSRPQLALLLVLVAAAGVGLGVGHWRRAYPDRAGELESIDRAPMEAAAPAAQPRLARAPKRAADGQPVDLNRASAAELETLPGVGAGLARRIVDARERDGPFTTLD